MREKTINKVNRRKSVIMQLKIRKDYQKIFNSETREFYKELSIVNSNAI